MGAAISMGENWIESSAVGKPGRAEARAHQPISITSRRAMTARSPRSLPKAEHAEKHSELGVKETDRLRAVATELRKLGAEVEQGGQLPLLPV